MAIAPAHAQIRTTEETRHRQRTARLENLYIACFVLVASLHIILLTTWGQSIRRALPPLVPLVRLVVALPLLYKFVSERHSTRECALVAALAALGGVLRITTGDYVPLFDILLVASAQNVRLERLAKALAISLTMVLVATIVLHFLGLSEGLVGRRRDTGALRPSLGFTNPNWTGFTCFEIVFALAFVCWRNKPWHHLGATIALLGLAYGICQSRSASISIVLVALIVQIGARVSPHTLRSRSFHTTLACGCLLVALAFAGITLSFTHLYNPAITWMARLNYFLSERLRMFSELSRAYPPNLLGRNFAQLPAFTYSNGWTQHIYVDNSYLRHLINYGLIFSVLIFGAIYATLAQATLEQHTCACLLLLMVTLTYALMEAIPLYVPVNPSLLALHTLLYRMPIRTLDLSSEQPHGTPHVASHTKIYVPQVHEAYR